MRLLIWFIVLVLYSSCSTMTHRLSPVEAGIPKLVFFYLKGDKWRQVSGHGGDVFDIGNKISFRVVPPSSGKWTLRYLSGSEDRMVGFPSGKEFLEIEDGEYTKETSSVIGFSLFDESKQEVVQGFFYPNVVGVKDRLNVEFQCPYKRTNNNISACSRPASFPFRYVVRAEHGELEVMNSTQCVSGLSKVTTDRIRKGKSKTYRLRVSDRDFCTIGLSSRQGEEKKLSSHFLHVRFYDPKYQER